MLLPSDLHVTATAIRSGRFLGGTQNLAWPAMQYDREAMALGDRLDGEGRPIVESLGSVFRMFESD